MTPDAKAIPRRAFHHQGRKSLIFKERLAGLAIVKDQPVSGYFHRRDVFNNQDPDDFSGLRLRAGEKKKSPPKEGSQEPKENSEDQTIGAKREETFYPETSQAQNHF